MNFGCGLSSNHRRRHRRQHRSRWWCAGHGTSSARARHECGSRKTWRAQVVILSFRSALYRKAYDRLHWRECNRRYLSASNQICNPKSVFRLNLYCYTDCMRSLITGISGLVGEFDSWVSYFLPLIKSHQQQSTQSPNQTDQLHKSAVNSSAVDAVHAANGVKSRAKRVNIWNAKRTAIERMQVQIAAPDAGCACLCSLCDANPVTQAGERVSVCGFQWRDVDQCTFDATYDRRSSPCAMKKHRNSDLYF